MSRPTLIIPQYPGNKHNLMNSQSIKRPALAIKSITGQTQFLVPVANSTMKNKLLVVPKKQVINYLKPMVKLTTNSSSDSKSSSSTSKSSSNAQSPHSTSILIRSSKSPKVPQSKSLSSGRTVTKLTEKQIKDHFMLSLGLVTKETLTELQSRKGERKRRTTANPQFSSAALEAKRITKLELAERKAKRRLLTNITNNNNSDISSEDQTKSTLNPISNPRSIGVEPQELLPGVYIVNSIGKSLPANCCVCEELCEYEIDSILFCKPCKALFHATCTVTKNDITEKAILPKCPKCEIERKKTMEKVTKKREERDSLMTKKKELDEQLAQMRRAFNCLKNKLKEKCDEKTTLLGNHDKVQQKIDKIINTLQLVEDTSEAEDRFDAHLEATAPQTRSPSCDQLEEQMETDENQPNAEDIDAMNDETCKAAEQLEQMNKQSANESLELADEENQIYDLECHENRAEMYDMMVEEVEENVNMISDDVHLYEDNDKQMKHDFSQEKQQQMMLC